MVILAIREPTDRLDSRDREDHGCSDISARCVDCHLPICLEEVSGGITTLRMERTRMLILGLHERGASTRTIANTLRVSRRTVFRVLEEA